MKRVMITIDYNPNSEKVVNMGYELAKLMQAEVCLFHVLAEVSYYGMQYEPFMGYEGYAFPVDYRIQEDVVKVAKDYLEKTFLEELNYKIGSTEGSRFNANKRLLEISRISNLCNSILSVYIIALGALSFITLQFSYNMFFWSESFAHFQQSIFPPSFHPVPKDGIPPCRG